MTTIDTERVSGTDMQGILGISHQTIARLQKAGVLTSIGAGKFRLADAVQAYVAYIDGGRATSEIASRKTSVLDEQHRKLKLANDLRERASIPMAEAELVADEAMLTFRSNLDGLAGRLSAQLAASSDPAIIKERLADEHRRVLEACSDRFARLAAAGTNGQSDPAATQTNRRPMGKRGTGAATGKRGAGAIP